MPASGTVKAGSRAAVRQAVGTGFFPVLQLSRAGWENESGTASSVAAANVRIIRRRRRVAGTPFARKS